MSSGARLQIRGTAVDAARRYARARALGEQHAQFVDSLAPSERRLYEGVVNRSAWYDVDDYGQMLAKAAQALAPDRQEEFLSEGGRFVVDDGVNTIYRAFFAIASPAVVLRGSALLWRRFFRGSRLRVLASGRSFVRARVDGPHCFKPLCISIRGGMMSSLAHGGARDVVCARHRCQSEGGTTCEFEFSWR